MFMYIYVYIYIYTHTYLHTLTQGGSVSELDALDVFGGAFKEADALLTDMDDGSTACTVYT